MRIYTRNMEMSNFLSFNFIPWKLLLIIVKTQCYPYSATTEEGVFNYNTYFLPWDEYNHNPSQLTDYPEYEVPAPLPETVNGTEYKIPGKAESPDFRQVEAPWVAFKENFYREMNRYYRINPAKFLHGWKNRENSNLLQCYCVTVFKKFTTLGMGAMITTRHIMTTALSTEMIVKKYQKKYTLEGILGAWYETTHAKHNNATVYVTPVRIHYHPRWNPPELTNRTHPLPCMYDISVWAAKKTFWGSYWVWTLGGPQVQLCNRCSGSGKKGWTPPSMAEEDLTVLVGAQMIMDIGRKPYPWFKYAVRTRWGKLQPCPKTEWGWFLCIEMRGMSPKLGVDVGSPLHITYENRISRYDGMAGMNSFTMRLRSFRPVNYYTVLDRHPVLDFLYSAYCGRLPYAYLDYRFEDTQFRAPFPKPSYEPTINYTANIGVDWLDKYYYYPIWWR